MILELRYIERDGIQTLQQRTTAKEWEDVATVKESSRTHTLKVGDWRKWKHNRQWFCVVSVTAYWARCQYDSGNRFNYSLDYILSDSVPIPDPNTPPISEADRDAEVRSMNDIGTPISIDWKISAETLEKRIEAIRAEEREKCIRIIRDHAADERSGHHYYASVVLDALAKKIGGAQ